MKRTLRKIDPMSAARVAALMGVVWGLSSAIVITFFSTSYIAYMGRFYTAFGTMMPVLGIASIVTLPLAYGVSGFVIAYIGSMIYNWIAKKFGGIKVDLK